MKNLKNIAVYCGSRPGNSMIYGKAAKDLASYLVEKNLSLVYGGGKVGLMGEIAEAALAEGGKVIGIIPKHLKDREVAHENLTELRVVDSMHNRKKMIEEISDAFIALPGGMGTIEEIFEMLTWAQLNLHNKPCAFYNVDGYFDHLIQFLDNMVKEGFMDKESLDMIIIENNIKSIFKKIENYVHPKIDTAKIAISKLES